jgi:hypothetical protein
MIYICARGAVNNDLQLGQTATGKHAYTSSIKRRFRELFIENEPFLY